MIGGACQHYSIISGKLEARAKVTTNVGITVKTR